MEALGVASGTAGLIALAEIIATKGYKYYARAKGARSEINDFVLEIQRLYAVLNQLRLLAICLEDEELTGTCFLWKRNTVLTKIPKKKKVCLPRVWITSSLAGKFSTN